MILHFGMEQDSQSSIEHDIFCAQLFWWKTFYVFFVLFCFFFF